MGINTTHGIPWLSLSAEAILTEMHGKREPFMKIDKGSSEPDFPNHNILRTRSLNSHQMQADRSNHAYHGGSPNHITTPN